MAARVWVLRRDGAEVCRGTELACWQYIHARHSFSVGHALRYEGYALAEAPP